MGGVGVPSPETLAHYVVTHDYLSASNVDGVKVDASRHRRAVKTAVGPRCSRVHMALEESVRAHFPENGIINCMSLHGEHL